MGRAIAVGASAGGLEALLKIVKELPPGLAAPVFVVVHYAPNFPSILPELLSRNGPVLAAHAQDGEPILPGRIYMAPPNYHLVVNGDQVRVWLGPKINGFRPAIDPLLRSTAEHYGARAVGVLLSGDMSDGVAGLLAIKRAGGVTVVQDPTDAAVPVLPQHAMATLKVDRILPALEMGRLFGQLARDSVQTGMSAMPDTIAMAEKAMDKDFAAQQRGERAGQVALFSCPHCGGVMRQTEENRLVEFLCHVGHAYEGEALLGAQAETVEVTAWSLVRALKERALLARELATLAHGQRDAAAEARLQGIAEEAERQQKLIEGRLLKRPQ